MAPRYVVVGAGAVGGTIGSRLSQAGHEVALIARGVHGEAIRRAGLLLRDPEGDALLRPLCVPHPADLGWRDDDVVVLATKTHQALPALEALAAHAPPSLAVVCATNGFETERLALRRFEQVVAMTVMLPAAHLRPGEVSAYSAPITGILDVGRYPEGTDDLVARVAADLEAATFSARADADVMRRKRQKLLMNLANVLDAACGPGARSGGAAELVARARAEGVACYEAAGLPFASDEEDGERRGDLLSLRPVGGERRGGGSTWQSLARRTGETEADYLNGEIVLLGRLHGVPTPVNEMLRRLAAELAATGAEPGRLRPEQLEARLA
ncbi:MAG: ketopantoate reductase family protein [Acidimicrobiia bacterium]|nr:ketopantoate reductase family protein [Acidimicrobiia bacterium]